MRIRTTDPSNQGSPRMRSSKRYLSALVVLGLGLLSLVWPASAQSTIRSRSVQRAIVHGREATVSRREATSFDLFGARPASKAMLTRADATAVPRAPQPVGT